MAVTQEKLKKRIAKDKDFFTKLEAWTKQDFKKLRGSWLSKEESLKQIRARITKEGGTGTLWLLKSEFEKTKVPEETTPIVPTGTTPVEPVEPVVDEPVVDEKKTLRERVTSQIATRKTREEAIKTEREEAGRWELEELRKWFKEEAFAVQEDISNIKAWLEAEWWAITSIAASRIREARSAPLREQLTSLVKGQELTSANIKELDTSVDAILEARRLDRQDEVKRITNSIEASTLSDEEKNKLLSDLWVQTKRMEQEEDIESFRQKEQIKADIKKADKESVASTWLTTGQNLTFWKILTNADLKEDSVIGKSVANLIKEWKTEQEINKILSLATDEEWNFVSDTQFSRREKLRKWFEAQQWVKDFRKASVDFAGLVDNIQEANWPWDIATLFQFMKTLDPTSVVRESEFDAIAKAMWFADRIDLSNNVNNIETWSLLWDKNAVIRQRIQKIAQNLFNKQKSNFINLATDAINWATADWVREQSVVLDMNRFPELRSLTELNEDDEIEVDNIFWGTESWSWKQFKFDEDIDFNKADQPATPKVAAQVTTTPKGKIWGILGWLQDKVTVVTKWWDNKRLWLFGGSLTFRTNNPLAITATWAWSAERLTNKFWAIKDLFSPDSADNLVLNFATVEEWLKAWRQLLEEKWNLTLKQLMESHTWTSAIWHKAQIQKQWLSLDTKFKDLSEEDKNKVIEAIKIAEWFKAWQIIT